MRKRKTWKTAAAWAVALAFVLSACGAGSAGNAAKTESVTEEAYAPQAAGGSYNSNAAESAYEDSADLADEDMPMAAMSASDGEDYTGDEGGESGGAAAKEGTDPSSDPAAQTDLQKSNRKIIYTGNISLQTLEYDQASNSIHAKITQYGGFIESEDTYNDDPYWYYKERTGSAANRTRRNLNITARIPADQFDAFMKDLEKDGQVVNSSINARNVSVTYATREASKKALEIEQSRLLEMMEKAESVEDMIRVEERLTEVERELNSEKTELSALDRDVNFSTIYISLQEVFEYSEKVVEVTYGERLQKAFGRAVDGFVSFWQELILFIVETFPFLIMLAIVIVLLRRLLRRRREKKAVERARLEEIRRRAAAQAQAGMGGMNGMPGLNGMPGAGPGAGGMGAPQTRPAKRPGFFRFGKKKNEEYAVPGSLSGDQTASDAGTTGAVQLGQDDQEHGDKAGQPADHVGDGLGGEDAGGSHMEE
jgi:hypothetical protein